MQTLLFLLSSEMCDGYIGCINVYHITSITFAMMETAADRQFSYTLEGDGFLTLETIADVKIRNIFVVLRRLFVRIIVKNPIKLVFIEVSLNIGVF